MCIKTYAIANNPTISTTIIPSCHASPTISILSGIISKTVSRSSKIARIRALRNSHVAPSPAAASIENNTPAEVGAANRPANSVSFHAVPSDQNSAGSMTKTKYPVTNIHGNVAAVNATK